mmetsp:Transcript_51437/g.122290  ORF Transcript_51437/g.122290 Transcript_51437/m.122290 type:complete len:258 (+) Transcript_51437:402-1175(+)
MSCWHCSRYSFSICFLRFSSEAPDFQTLMMVMSNSRSLLPAMWSKTDIASAFRFDCRSCSFCCTSAAMALSLTSCSTTSLHALSTWLMVPEMVVPTLRCKMALASAFFLCITSLSFSSCDFMSTSTSRSLFWSCTHNSQQPTIIERSPVSLEALIRSKICLASDCFWLLNASMRFLLSPMRPSSSRASWSSLTAVLHVAKQNDKTPASVPADTRSSTLLLVALFRAKNSSSRSFASAVAASISFSILTSTRLASHAW